MAEFDSIGAAPFDVSTVFDLLPIPFIVVRADDPVFTFVAVNRAYTALCGVDPDRLLGHGVFDVFPDDAADPASTGTRSLRASYRRVIAHREPDRMPCFRYDVAQPDGFQVRYFSSENTPLFDAQGRVEFIIQSVQEVTDRVLAEEQAAVALSKMEASETRFHQLAESSGFGLVIAAQDGGLSYVNPAVLQLLGYQAEDLAAGLLRWDQLTPAEFRARDAEAWHEVHATGRCAPYEKVYRAKDGRYVPVLIGASLLAPRNGITEVAAFIVDLTEKKRSESTAFLVAFDDATRALSHTAEIEHTAVRLLGDYLKVDRCSYTLYAGDSDTLVTGADYYSDAQVDGDILSQFRSRTVAFFRANLPDILHDSDDAQHAEALQDEYRLAGLRAHASVPVYKEGKLVAAISVHQTTPRPWSTAEVELVQLVANRCWESTERVRAAGALQASERRLRLAQRAARIGTFEWDIRADHITWSPELEELYGLPEGTFEQSLKVWPKYAHPDDAKAVIAALERCMAQHQIDFECDFRALLPDGKFRWLRAQGMFVYDEDGPVRMIGVNIDYDAQKKTEAHLKQQWMTFDTVLSNIPDALYVFDSESKFLYANRTLLARLNMSLADVLGRDGSALGYPPEIVDRIKSQIKQVFRFSKPVRDEMPLHLPNGDTRHYEYILTPVLDAEGGVEAVAGSTRDITERKLAEEREQKRQEQIRESAHLESLGIMAGGIAHDFNNLLTGILGNASLLAECGSLQNRVFAKDIVLAAERAADLTSQMLAYSGKGRFLVESVDLNVLIQENLTLLRASLPRTVTVELDLSSSPCFIEGDRTQMQQIVMNLLLNAAEAAGGHPGRIAVRTTHRERDSPEPSARLKTILAPGPYIVLEVRDFGCGMSPEVLKKIFEPFFTTKFTGRGLGLAAVLGIVKGHHGDLEVESTSGEGTLFRISLPAAQHAPVPRATRPMDRPVPSHRTKILVVDDEEVVRRTARAALEAEGFVVLEASDGREGIDILGHQTDLSLVILDLSMPVLSGEEALPLMQAQRPGAAIVLSSGYSESEVAHRFAELDLAGFLQKPYTARAIVEKVTEVSEKWSARFSTGNDGHLQPEP